MNQGKAQNLNRRTIDKYPVRSRKETIEKILNTDKIKYIIKRASKRNNIPQFLVTRKAKLILKEMTSNLGRKPIRLSYRLFKFVWNKIFDRLYVDTKSLQALTPIIENNPVILIPSHKSHLDYLLVSSVFHEHGLTPPYIAAGVNLAFWPFGYIFRKIGAFFIRRAIGSDILYFKLLFEYMSLLIREKHSQEFFIEGGRSRNGKLQSPKLGLLTLQIDSFLEENIEDLFFVPISIAYDRILEENAYYKEIIGGEKTKESLWEVIKSVRVLNSQYGNAYVNFGSPISLKEVFGKSQSEKLTPKIKKSLIKKLGDRIIKDINLLTPITPTALIALTLLSRSKKEITHDELISTAKLFLSFFKETGIKISEELTADEKSILSGIKFLADAKFLWTDEKAGEKTYRFRSKQRVWLDYYKNNIIHYCVPLFFASASLHKSRTDTVSTKTLQQDIEFLKGLFVNEFLIDISFQTNVSKALDWLKSRGIITEKISDGTASIEILDRSSLKVFYNSFAKFLEAYYLAAIGTEGLLNGEFTLKDSDLTHELLKVGLNMLRKGQIGMREAVTIPPISNALKYINRHVIKSLKSILPGRYLEEEEELPPHFHEHDPESELQEKHKLEEMISKLKEYLDANAESDGKAFKHLQDFL